ncbi:MAG TPA: DUF2961 domain-containing protein [Clostridiales bacterium]|nr:MAG: hypothetical protein BWY37_01886 [Firmicutes bacterium ADurb.Bin262]HOU10173.1 DUF2961 domain-containing protein [Clostridiales bacterium]HQK73081.1 DUF2961 domain-containing protein [Clostridiales bacterium]
MRYNGLNNSMANLWQLSDAKTRSICCENPTGGKGAGAMCELEDGSAALAARDLGKGWKVNPFMAIAPNSTVVLADIEGPGCIEHIWMTPDKRWRDKILRIYWDGQDYPSVECPVGDFFACGWNEYAQVSSLAVCVNPGSAFNCYWQMPFKKRCLMTLENLGESSTFFYQIDYCLTEVPDDAAYFHAQFRRSNPLPYKSDHIILGGAQGKGQYVGTYMCWGVHNNGWWGEGEIKFFLDGDGEYPTICGTGTEDYFCGSYNFENRNTHQYQEFSTPYSGLCQVLRPDGLYHAQTRFGLYRWHITDPIRFENDIRVTIQALGWRNGGRYLPLQDDISSVAFWYQTLPGRPLEPLPDRDGLEII